MKYIKRFYKHDFFIGYIGSFMMMIPAICNSFGYHLENFADLDNLHYYYNFGGACLVYTICMDIIRYFVDKNTPKSSIHKMLINIKNEQERIKKLNDKSTKRNSDPS